MATASVSYTFALDAANDPAPVNQNFTDLVTFLNNSVVHKDGSTTMTGQLTLPSSDPTTANQATRKQYVDNQSVRVFASTAARDAAIPTPTAGMVCYIDAGDATEGLWTYNGTTWRQRAWNEPWGYLTTFTGGAGGSILRAGSSSAPVTIVSGNYTHVANRRVRASAFAGLRFTGLIGHAYRLFVAGSNATYIFSTADNDGFCHVAVGTTTAASLNYSVTCEFAAAVSDIYHAANPAYIILEDIGPATGAPS